MRRLLIAPAGAARLGAGAAGLALLIVGCAQAPTQAETDPTGIPWELTSGTVDGAEVTLVEGFPITLNLTSEDASGTAACNRYGASVAISGSSITFGELASTAMDCMPEQVMDSERQFIQVLPRIDAYSVTEDRLTLTGEGVELGFIALPPAPVADLTGTVWVLVGLVEGDSVSGVAGERATLELYTDGSMLGSTGCRSLHGRYVVAGAEVIMSEMAAEGECPADLQDQDGHVVTVLGDGFRAAVSGQELTLTDPGGQGLVYRADS